MQNRNPVHVMLDLITASVVSKRSVILEIAAIQFNIDTGEELSRFYAIVNAKSCSEVGLKSDINTLQWVEANLPNTLYASLNPFPPARELLPAALAEFTAWLKHLDGFNPRTCSIWSRWASQSNGWIMNAFEAIGMEYPWESFGDSCVRTLVKECVRRTGKDFKLSVPYEGERYVARNECKHQIKYLVAARNELWAPLRNRNAHLPTHPAPKIAPLPVGPETKRKLEESDRRAAEAYLVAARNILWGLELGMKKEALPTRPQRKRKIFEASRRAAKDEPVVSLRRSKRLCGTKLPGSLSYK